MTLQNHHIIQRQIIEINFEKTNDSFGLQNEIADAFHEKLQPMIEMLFDEMFGENTYAYIDRLEVDCGMLNKKNWEQELTDNAIRKIKEELIQINAREKNAKRLEEAVATEAFFFYLENGFMPWNNRFNTIAELEELLIINEKLVDRLKSLISQKSKAPERLALQFSKNFTSRIIEEISKGRQETLNEIFDILDELNLLQIDKHSYKNIDKHIVDVAILNIFSSDQNRDKVDQFFNFLLSKIDGNTELKTEIKEIVNYLNANNKKPNPSNADEELQPEKDEEKEKQESDNIENEAIFIKNAGLVLLHPFLQALFENIDILKKDLWVNSDSQQIAVLVTEYLVTGSDKFEEFDLVFNKIICGLHPGEIVNTGIKLADEIKSECESLFKQVIKHWSVLKNTGADGLRDAFLQRNGKLSEVDNHRLLQVEHKAIDTLLNQLPWGIGIVKLPWMNEMLYVEWT